MLKNYLKIALRNLWKNKAYSFINIFGLMIGLGCFLLIALYIFDELTYDRFHKQSDNIYRIVENKTATGGKASNVASVAYQISEQATAKYAGEVKNAVRMIMLGRANFSNPANANTFYETIWVANKGFLETFDFPLISGDRKTALNDPNSIIITEQTAIKYFGSTDVIGKSLKNDRDNSLCKVTAVLKTLPVNSHFSFDLLQSESNLTENSAEFRTFANTDWNSNSFVSYLLLSPTADPKKVQKEVNQLVASNRKADNATKSNFTLQALKDIHFHSQNIEGNWGRTGNLPYIYIFSIVGLFVLLVACINYMNLTTARFASRAKEIAVRKFAGASRKNLIGQFLSEAMLMTLFALMLALIGVKLFLPYFNAFTEKNLLLGAGTDYRIWLGIAGIVLIVGLVSGTYPAFIQSRVQPLILLKNKIDGGKGSFSIRRALVVVQFALSIIMIAATMIVYLQLKYINSKDMGFSKDQLLIVDINSGKVRRNAETLKTEFNKLAAVSDVSVSSRVPGEWKNLPKAKVKNESIMNDGTDMYFIGIDDQFLKTYSINLLKGRNFSAANIADSSSVLINETAAKMLGIKQPSEQLIEIPSVDWSGNVDPLEHPFKARVIGIVSDFNFQSLRETISPMVLAYQKNPIHNIDYFTAKVSSQDMAATLKQVEGVLHQTDPNHLFEYNFLDKQWELFYREDKKRESIFIAVAILTILIACLGLFGLATYAAEQRIREIGIRKVLGASISGIVSMLCKDFLKLVLIAAVIAFPIAWWAMHKWLLDFAYRINISWWIFAVAGLGAVMIALLTVSFQAIRAAVANPVKSLRTE